jgi:hypothetical protein
MRTSRLAFVAALAAGVAFAGYRVVLADGEPGMSLQKPMAASFLDSLVGSWTVATEMKMGPAAEKHNGTAKFWKGVGDTAVLEDYESSSMGGFRGHAIYKLSADGKTMSCWWLDNMEGMNEPIHFSGPITDKGIDMKAELPGGAGTLRITMEKKDAGVVFNMFMNGTNGMTDTYTRAK